MSLDEWLEKGWLVRHQTSPQEIAELLQAADRDLADCRAAGLSADWRLNIAHNAVILSATAALAACGYRVRREAHHYRMIQSLIHTIGAERGLVKQLDRFRRKRNVGAYERARVVSEEEACEIVALAGQLRDTVGEWLEAEHLELLAG